MSKAQSAVELYASMTTAEDGTPIEVKRNDIINAFVSQLGMSVQGASTYHHNIKNGVKGWTLESRAEKAAANEAAKIAKAEKAALREAEKAEKAAQKAALMAAKSTPVEQEVQESIAA